MPVWPRLLIISPKVGQMTQSNAIQVLPCIGHGDQLSVYDGFVLYDDKIVIPKVLQVHIFARYGIPNIAFSDGEPIYASVVMKKFCEKYNIDKCFSSA